MSIYLKLFHITLSKLFHICFGLDILSLTDASACPNLLLYQDLSELTSSKYTKILFCIAGHKKRDLRVYKKPLGPSFFLDYSLFTALFFLLCIIL